MTIRKTWFITGTSSGIGLELARKLLARGDRVAATARKPAVLDALKAQYPDQLWVAKLDVTDTQQVKAVVAQAFAECGPVEVIVSNAGYALFGAGEEVSDEQIVEQINTNLIGSIQVIRAALPLLRAQGGGRILQVSSEGGQIAYPNFSLYHATKWGIEGFVEAVAQEVAPFNIDFTLVEPGPAKTGFAAGLVSPPAMSAYENTPAGEMRKAIASGNFDIKGDAGKMADAIIASVDTHPAPLRLTLGSDAYQRVRAGLTKRIDALDAQKAIAHSTDGAP